MSKLLRLRRRSQSRVTTSTQSRIPAWAVFFWLAQFRRWGRYLWREIVALGMITCTKFFYKVEVRGLHHFKYDPATIVACSHKRDGDIPLVIPRLYMFHRPSHRKALRMIYVATRDDVYENGFLTVYFPLLDRWFRPVISRIRVARLFKQVQTCPVKLPDEQTVNQLLQETKRLDGDLLLSEALTPEWQVKLVGAELLPGSDLRLSDALAHAPLPVLAQYATPRMFKEPLSTSIMKRHHQLIVSQLRNISRIMDKGGVIFIAPEGRVTPDGRFGKMRAALTRAVQQCRADVKMTPVNVTYDFMDIEKPLVIVNIGPEVLSLKSLSKNELAEVVRRSVAGLACVTMSGLASRWLIEQAGKGQSKVAYRQMLEELWAEAQQLKELNLPMDARLEMRPEFEARLSRFVGYAFKKGKIFTNPQALQALDGETVLELDCPALLREECQKHDDHPARYSYNELLSLLDAHDLLEEKPVSAPVVFNLAEERKRRLTAG